MGEVDAVELASRQYMLFKPRIGSTHPCPPYPMVQEG